MRFTDNASIESSAMMTDDILAGTDVSEGTDKKFTLANLGAWFLENFNGTIGGKNQSVLSAIESKADAAGVSEELTAGTAGQLLSDSYTEDFTPYKFRRSPYTDRLSESIVGASCVWNQLVNTSDTSVTVPSGHKYLSRISGTDAMGASTGTAITVTGTDNVHDLTAMFGTAVADALYAMGADGVALFRSWYPNDYYEYTAPTLEHVENIESHDMVGFNQWDEVWEVGDLSVATGANISGSDRIRSKNYIPVFPSTAYYLKDPTGERNTRVVLYDGSKNFVRATGWIGNEAFSTNQNEHYMRFMVAGVYGNVYKNDICINISDPTRNGQYKPYEKHTYALDASLTLRGLIKYDSAKGIYADGDTYAPDGTVTRKYGVVDLGTLTWNYDSPNARFYAPFNLINKTGYTNADAFPMLCANYQTVKFYSGGAYMGGIDKSIAYAPGAGSRFYVTDSAYSDAASFKAAMSGVYLVYELATPTTEEAEPYDAIQITDGTEEYVTECLAPVGHESKYYENLRSKIEGLPTDFSAIICATEATNKASRNYAVGDYLIHNNTLYKVTTAIASDASLTVGTNITATTIMAEIKALQ